MALTQAELIEIWRRVLPESYTVPLEDEADGRGVDVIESIAAVMARVAGSVETTTQAMYIAPHSIQTAPPAAGATEATGSLILTRTPPTAGDLDLFEGDPLLVEVRTPDDEVVLEANVELSADVTMVNGSKGPTAASIVAARAGYQGNVPDTQGHSVAFKRGLVMTVELATTNGVAPVVITDNGDGDRFDAGMVGQFVNWTAGPNVAENPRRVLAVTVGPAFTSMTLDGALAVAASALNTVEVVDVNVIGILADLDGDMSGGVHPWLDEIGGERNIGRNAHELDAAYRPRVQAIPDTVAPNALQRAAQRILGPIGVPFEISESRGTDITGAAWDHSPWDDTAADVGLLGRHHFWQGERFAYQGFYVVVQREGYGDPGACWDYDPGVGGVHPSAAWDYSPWDGAPYEYYDDLERLVAEIEKTRVAGVPWLLVLVDSVP